MPRKPKTESGKMPWMMWYVQDWRSDPCVARMSTVARGIWRELLDVMHLEGRSGELRGTTDELARLARCQTAEMAHTIDELLRTKAADVTLRNGNVTLINRRMEREYKSRAGSALRMARKRGGGTCYAPVTPHISEVICHIPLNPPEGDGERPPDRKPDIRPNPESAAVPWVDPLAAYPELADLFDDLLHGLATDKHGKQRVSPFGVDVEVMRGWRWALAALVEVDGHAVETVVSVCQWVLAGEHEQAQWVKGAVYNPGHLRDAAKISKGQPSMFQRALEKWRAATGAVDQSTLTAAERAEIDESEHYLRMKRKQDNASNTRLNV